MNWDEHEPGEPDCEAQIQASERAQVAASEAAGACAAARGAAHPADAIRAAADAARAAAQAADAYTASRCASTEAAGEAAVEAAVEAARAASRIAAARIAAAARMVAVWGALRLRAARPRAPRRARRCRRASRAGPSDGDPEPASDRWRAAPHHELTAAPDRAMAAVYTSALTATTSSYTWRRPRVVTPEASAPRRPPRRSVTYLRMRANMSSGSRAAAEVACAVA